MVSPIPSNNSVPMPIADLIRPIRLSLIHI